MKHPAVYYATRYVGSFEPNERKISGAVADAHGDNAFPPRSIVVFREKQQIGTTTEFQRGKDSWAFDLEATTAITLDDILHDRIHVFALDGHGTRSALNISGAVQLEYLRSGPGATAERELTIDFSQGGNSRNYVRNGWWHAEAGHTWTKGSESTIEVPFASPTSRYGMELLLWPFLVPQKHESQTLTVSISGMLIEKFHPRGQQFLEFDIPPEFTRSGGAIIHFGHPEALRPSDFGGSQDDRDIALAFQRVRLKRYRDHHH